MDLIESVQHNQVHAKCGDSQPLTSKGNLYGADTCSISAMYLSCTGMPIETSEVARLRARRALRAEQTCKQTKEESPEASLKQDPRFALLASFMLGPNEELKELAGSQNIGLPIDSSCQHCARKEHVRKTCPHYRRKLRKLSMNSESKTGCLDSTSKEDEKAASDEKPSVAKAVADDEGSGAAKTEDSKTQSKDEKSEVDTVPQPEAPVFHPAQSTQSDKTTSDSVDAVASVSHVPGAATTNSRRKKRVGVEASDDDEHAHATVEVGLGTARSGLSLSAPKDRSPTHTPGAREIQSSPGKDFDAERLPTPRSQPAALQPGASRNRRPKTTQSASPRTHRTFSFGDSPVISDAVDVRVACQDGCANDGTTGERDAPSYTESSQENGMMHKEEENAAVALRAQFEGVHAVRFESPAPEENGTEKEEHEAGNMLAQPKNFHVLGCESPAQKEQHIHQEAVEQSGQVYQAWRVDAKADRSCQVVAAKPDEQIEGGGTVIATGPKASRAFRQPLRRKRKVACGFSDDDSDLEI